MKAVILAGGEGTRLRPLTESIPKPFVRVAGRPTIAYVIESLVRGGFDQVLLTTFYKPEELVTRLAGGTKLGATLFYSVEDDAMGTAGGVARARAFLDDTFIVSSGDVLADIDVRALLEAHRKSGAIATMALTKVEDPTEFGIVGLARGAKDDVDPGLTSGRIVRFKEKPKREEAFSNLVNAGIYVLEPEVLDLIPKSEKYDFSKNLFPKLLEEGRHLQGEVVKGFWMDVGRPADLLTATRRMAEHRGEWPYVKSDRIAKDATVTDTAVYEGVEVASGATVEASLLFDQVKVGANARIRNSILDAGAEVQEGAEIADCVLGRGAVIPKDAVVKGAKVAGGETWRG